MTSWKSSEYADGIMIFLGRPGTRNRMPSSGPGGPVLASTTHAGSRHPLHRYKLDGAFLRLSLVLCNFSEDLGLPLMVAQKLCPLPGGVIELVKKKWSVTKYGTALFAA